MAPTLSTGEQAQRLVAVQLTRLRSLRSRVLQDDDPEALHQFRVSLRRIRSLISQFEAALELPQRLKRSRIAALARATGDCRDADVLREQLEQRLLPRLPASDHQACRPLLRQLQRQRRRAFRQLETALRSQRCRNLLQQLEQWTVAPRTTCLGQQPLEAWLPEWRLASSSCCFLQAGWFASDPDDPALHVLRKRVKEVRYGMESLREWLGVEGAHWISDLRSVQSCLGDLHDQQVLIQLVQPQGRAHRGLRQALEQERQERWLQWLQLRDALLQPQRRHGLLRLQLPT